jgi:hypothetical protein
VIFNTTCLSFGIIARRAERVNEGQQTPRTERPDEQIILAC